jgi:hypothetical protein
MKYIKEQFEWHREFGGIKVYHIPYLLSLLVFEILLYIPKKILGIVIIKPSEEEVV